VSLTHRTISGIKWSTASQITRQGLRILALLVLARIIGPKGYGVVAMALVVIGFIDLFRDLGTTAAVIQRKDPDQRLLSTVFWTNLAVGSAATAVTFAGAPLAALIYHNEQVTGVLRALSLSFIIAALGLVQLALLQKSLRFRVLAALEGGGAVVSSAVAIIAAVLGMGPYSLVLQSLAFVAIMTSGGWMGSRWRPSWVFALDDLRSIWAYSANVVGFDVVNYFARNADNLLIGRYLGATSLGYYAMAYNVLLFPLQMVSFSLSRVTFPAYAEVQHDKPRIARGYLRVVQVIATFTFPVLTGITVLASPLVELVYGPKWSPAATILMILVPVGLVQSLSALNGSIYRAIGRTDLQLRIGLLWSALVLASFVVGIQWGVVGVAASYAVTSTVILGYPLFKIPLSLIDLRVRDLLNSVWRPLLASATMAAVVLGARLLGPALETHVAGLASLVALGVLSYGAVSWIVNRAELLSIVGLLGLSGERSDSGALGGPRPFHKTR
jgi:O-antigen/teichoic acid export membrane protein